jgi:hypothetical protein
MRPFLTSVKESRGYSDLFLISPEGECLFAVTKGEVWGSNIITGPYRDSSLAKVFERTKSMLDAEVSDFDYYQASNESSAFIAAPVMRGSNADWGDRATAQQCRDLQALVGLYRTGRDRRDSGQLAARREARLYGSHSS